MGKLVFGPTSTLTVNGVDLSDHVTNVSVETSADEVDVTGMTEAFREFLPGLKDATITATFLQDFAASSVDATLYPLYSTNAVGTVKVKPDTAGTVVYTMVSKLYSFPPVNGGVGDALTTDVTFSLSLN